MNSSIPMMALSQFAHQIPALAVCITAIVLLLPRRTAAPVAIAWAVAGFGLAAGVSFLLPAAYTLLMVVQMHSGGYGTLTWAYSVIGVLASLLHAASFLLLLTACLHFSRQPRT